jgi:hypothetical protein
MFWSLQASLVATFNEVLLHSLPFNLMQTLVWALTDEMSFLLAVERSPFGFNTLTVGHCLRISG